MASVMHVHNKCIRPTTDYARIKNDNVFTFNIINNCKTFPVRRRVYINLPRMCVIMLHQCAWWIATSFTYQINKVNNKYNVLYRQLYMLVIKHPYWNLKMFSKLLKKIWNYLKILFKRNGICYNRRTDIKRWDIPKSGQLYNTSNICIYWCVLCMCVYIYGPSSHGSSAIGAWQMIR